MTNMHTLTTIADHAAAQGDRWLFVAMLIVTASAVGWLFRWLVGQYTGLSTRLAEVIQRNSDALHQVEAAVSWCRRKNPPTEP